MKRLTLAFCAAAMVFAACNNETKTAGESTTKSPDTMTSTAPKPAETYTQPDSATMMKNWMEYSTPGDVQKMMASWSGSWTGEMTMWESPEKPPQTATLKTINKMILGGRYQISNHSGTMMGMPFEGQETLAFDNATKMFISTWIDNMGTGLTTLKGPWDATNKTITLSGKMVDPGAGNGREIETRQVFTIIDDNNQKMEMYCSGPTGKEYKNMEIKFTRKK
ncbi:MAG: DUF1579 domain-containing protein [Chitinophagaceae bacterium]|nr:MAG: DUF1579 domain-containing protein [Chitinophagaceae bacterium]